MLPSGMGVCFVLNGLGLALYGLRQLDIDPEEADGEVP